VERIPETHSASSSDKGVGWFRIMRGDTWQELVKANPLAYVLAAVIAELANAGLDEATRRAEGARYYRNSQKGCLRKARKRGA
jgi:hypothetical protein